MINKEYKKGNLTGKLQITQTENFKYKWVNCLALLDKDGKWLISEHWQTNHFNVAHKEILKNGYIEVKTGE